MLCVTGGKQKQYCGWRRNLSSMWPQAPSSGLTGACRVGFHILLGKNKLTTEGRKSRGHSGFERAAEKEKPSTTRTPSSRSLLFLDSPGDPCSRSATVSDVLSHDISSPWTCLLFPCPCSSVLSISYFRLILAWSHFSSLVFPLLRECTQGVAQRTPFSDNVLLSLLIAVQQFSHRNSAPRNDFFWADFPVSEIRLLGTLANCKDLHNFMVTSRYTIGVEFWA